MLLNNHHCCASIYGPVIKGTQHRRNANDLSSHLHLVLKKSLLSFFFRYCNLNHFNAENISGSHLEETLLLHEKSLKLYGSTREFSSSIDLWETALWNYIWLHLSYEQSIHCFPQLNTLCILVWADIMECLYEYYLGTFTKTNYDSNKLVWFCVHMLSIRIQ